ncbi:hypothetical protein B0H16DRAFT_1512688 [Mycena metata]|uniref:Hydrophobin n=1 Tax=Mycena metata TaxID=1033252 RepID=A0AAD7JUT0_9AGAR|nr:hypothetical protein B0H16DRAFT_1512688 [Mycena metata]
MSETVRYKRRRVPLQSSLEHSPSFKLSSVNMFSKLSIVVLSALLTLAAAIPTSTPPIVPPTSDQCCSSVVPSSNNAAAAVLATLGINLGDITVPVGLSCSPITVVGNNCGGVTTRCDAPEIEWGGLIAINCIPITL